MAPSVLRKHAPPLGAPPSRLHLILVTSPEFPSDTVAPHIRVSGRGFGGKHVLGRKPARLSGWEDTNAMMVPAYLRLPLPGAPEAGMPVWAQAAALCFLPGKHDGVGAEKSTSLVLRHRIRGQMCRTAHKQPPEPPAQSPARKTALRSCWGE
ncbi:hypothetical protein H920_18346 [Fukomys damarensis]|uniref:Uncharacterized protein n=1 Tax=Fukomys damarensis TaxID=885580 RepID=A0A091CMY1_FUKDA|nr:hypothetical protein H920_18346 [Fukomys damarensis]